MKDLRRKMRGSGTKAMGRSVRWWKDCRAVRDEENNAVGGDGWQESVGPLGRDSRGKMGL